MLLLCTYHLGTDLSALLEAITHLLTWGAILGPGGVLCTVRRILLQVEGGQKCEDFRSSPTELHIWILRASIRPAQRVPQASENWPRGLNSNFEHRPFFRGAHFIGPGPPFLEEAGKEGSSMWIAFAFLRTGFLDSSTLLKSCPACTPVSSSLKARFLVPDIVRSMCCKWKRYRLPQDCCSGVQQKN